jgi:hypothetical protein
MNIATAASANSSFRKIDGWTGRGRWNARPQYSAIRYMAIWQSQTQDIVVADNRLIIRNDLSISTAPGGNGR